MAQPPEAITNYVITSRAAYEMGRRGLSQTLVDGILAAPEQRPQSALAGSFSSRGFRSVQATAST